jgi:hypothetical protein
MRVLAGNRFKSLQKLDILMNELNRYLACKNVLAAFALLRERGVSVKAHQYC